MGSRALLMLTNFNFKTTVSSFGSATNPFFLIKNNLRTRNFSTKTRSSLQPPDLPGLAETARISLAPNEVEEFAPKIGQVIDWFGQLQVVDLDNVEPAIRAALTSFLPFYLFTDTEGDNLREDVPQTFENKEALIASVPSYEEPYIKVPKVLNKE
ncbi:glutamyl-tRNA(Gln) amidotransferase subunit C, chloroplastic/mitochondrial [Gossypium australe]|uniref:Glutamyl-tRNA(Gln) amidotransferase subunit C, chloroplastic/mitochondrial n=1 Tax=Gossypium australe TaxID=47621 RepID=A0A5B6ULA1_9ROSI|nr:glutamyl-tRNA(Gln) amidotransferase subunit C, chloroplastic/mitochondrial [Gossypium australe]